MARNWSEQTEITKRKRVGRWLLCGRAERAIIRGYEKDNIYIYDYSAQTPYVRKQVNEQWPGRLSSQVATLHSLTEHIPKIMH
jgi:hypothetical protein